MWVPAFTVFLREDRILQLIHPLQEFIGRQEIHDPQIGPFITSRLQENDSGHPLNVIETQQSFLCRISTVGKIDPYHDKIFYRCIDNRAIMKGGLVQMPAGGAPLGIKIDYYGLARFLGLGKCRI